MKNFTIAFDNVDELVNFVYATAIDTPQTLIQIFCARAEKAKIQQIQNYFLQNYPKSFLIGATTDGIIDGKTIYNATKSSVTFTIFEHTHLKTALVEYADLNDNYFSAGEMLASRLCQDDTKVMISFADGIHTNGEELVKGIYNIAPNITLSGGLAGDNGFLEKTYVFDKEKMTSAGVVGVALNSTTLHTQTRYTFDWIPLGKKLQVTKAIKNRIYEIEGMSAVDIYAKYFGSELANRLPQVGIEFPLIFEKDGVSVGRAVLFKHNDGSLTFAGNIPEGTYVRFGVGNVEHILQNSNYQITKMVDESQYVPEAVFVYSCMARRRFMNASASDELEILNQLGKVSGFFTYGEFFHGETKNQLLNETMTLLALSEGSESPMQIAQVTSKKADTYVIRAEHVIANLANKVSQELGELNETLEKRIQESSDYIYKQAYFDKLTTLPNRLSLIKALQSSVGKLIILVNIDDFTTINDYYGHIIGDQILVKMAAVLKSLAQKYDASLFKLPSDEYALVMQRPNTLEDKRRMLQEILRRVADEKFVLNDTEIQITVTVATALVDKNGTGLVNADMALKLAKKSAKNYVIYDENLKLSSQYRKNIEMVKTIKNALAHDRFVPYFQPLLNLHTGKIEKYEALIRLQKEDGRVLAPFFFLEISQKIKVYSELTAIMIEKTFAYFQNRAMDFSINLSFSDILNQKTQKFLFEKIQEYGIASQLTIEILETQENDGEIALKEFINEVYKVGASIAIDDFGSGYANFTHITDIQSDFMKIDGSLIKNLDSDANARLIVETIIVFARKLNKKIVAEFVHSQEICEIVKAMGVDYIQGYYIGEPLPEILDTTTLQV